MLRLVWIFSIAFYSFNIDPDYLDWSADASLTFADFKGTPPAGSDNPVNLSTVLTYQTRQVAGQPPEIIIFNRMDRNNSWISVRKEEILRIQQIHFNISEVYARKIRKEIKKLAEAKVTEKEKYVNVIKKYSSELTKVKGSKKILLEDQPTLTKIWEKEINDSLNLYKDFAK